jgi:3-dehydroquinate dehydratase-2
MNIQIINGPNLNLLGKREPSIYGNCSFEDYLNRLREKYAGIEIGYFQSNSEGELIDTIQTAGFQVDAIILNAGAYTHTSIALHDAIRSVLAPVIEVHISNVHSREEFRRQSMIASACKGVICGFGMESYRLAVEAALSIK